MDINKEFEKLVEEFEKEWHDGHEPQGIDDQYVEEMEDGEEVEIDEKFAGWIAFYNKDKLEIKPKKGVIDSLNDAKQAAIKHFKVPKSKQGLLAIEPAHEEVEAYAGTKKWKKGQNKMKKAGITLQKKDKFSGYVEDVEEASTYRDKARDDEKKKKRHFAFGGKKDKTRHGAGGYGKGSEEVGVDEAKSKLPPHLAKFFDKDGNLKKDAAARVAKGREKINWIDVTPKGYGPKEEDTKHSGGETMMNFKQAMGEAFFKVNIPDMPPVFIEGGSASAIKQDMRKKLKPDVLKGLEIEKVSRADMAKMYRKLAKGDSEEGEAQEEVSESMKLQATMALGDAGIKINWKGGKLYVPKKDIKKAEI